MSSVCSNPIYVGSTHFWEQVAKHRRCFDMVERHENEIGRRYDYVMKIRPDMPQAVLSNLPGAMLMRFQHQQDRTDNRTIWLHSNSDPPIAFMSGYAGTDHLALVPRAQAENYFRFSSAVTCPWIEERNVRLKVQNDMYRNEHVLIDWVMAHGAQVRRLYWPWQPQNNWTREEPRSCGKHGVNCNGPPPPPSPPRHPPAAARRHG